MRITTTIKRPDLTVIGRDAGDHSPIYEEIGTREVEVSADVQLIDDEYLVGSLHCAEWLDNEATTDALDALVAEYERLERLGEAAHG